MEREDSDAPGQAGAWELAGSVRVARRPCGWVTSGGWEEDDAVGLHVIVQHPDDPELIRRERIRIPLRVEAGLLIVGEPELVPES